jgi:hypothetical protein
MSKVVALFQSTAFDPETIDVLARAYDKARKSLHKGQPEIVQVIIAERIIAEAKYGERDPDKLCKAALSALGDKAISGRR